MSACARGCVQHGQHNADCADDTCTGCLPRQTIQGALCAACSYHLDEWLSNDKPGPEWLLEPVAANRRDPRSSLAMALWAVQTATSNGPVGIAYDLDRVGHQADPPAPVSLARLDWITDLHATIQSWLQAWCEHRGLTGIDIYSLEAACAYLAQWQDELAAWEPITAMWDELAELMRRGHALAPWRQQARPCDGVPCPDCGHLTLVVYSGDDVVTCRTCRAIVHRDEYTRWVEHLADDARPQPITHWAVQLALPAETLRKRVTRAGLTPDGRDRNGRKLYYRDSLAALCA